MGFSGKVNEFVRIEQHAAELGRAVFVDEFDAESFLLRVGCPGERELKAKAHLCRGRAPACRSRRSAISAAC